MSTIIGKFSSVFFITLILFGATVFTPPAKAIGGSDFYIDYDYEDEPQFLGDFQTGTVTVDGFLETETEPAVYMWGFKSTLNNNGDIWSLEAPAVYYDEFAEFGTINNNGYIGSLFESGVQIDGYALTLNNSGEIESILYNGVSDYGWDTTINNSGDIWAWGEEDPAAGLLLEGEYATVNNSGFIGSYYGAGLVDAGYASTINNSGEIWAEEGYGLIVEGAYGSTINNSGLIESEDGLAVGIYGSDETELNNSGTIQSLFDPAIAVEESWFTLINNSGTIQSLDESGISLRLFEAAIIRNSGLISGNFFAIEALDGGYTQVDLLKGSVIEGIIALNTDYSVVNIDNNRSSVLEIWGADEINFVNGGAGVIDGEMVITVDTSGDAERAANMSATTTAIHGVVASRLSHKSPMKLARVAALDLAPGSLYREEPARAWGEVFTLERTRDDDANILDYEQKVSGFTGGYEYDNKGSRIGFMGGFASSSSETDKIKSIETDTDTVFLGAYGRFFPGKVGVTVSLVAGSEQHENERHVFDLIEGAEIAKSDYDSFFISPSISIDGAEKIGTNFEVRPSISVTYTTADFDGYRETGTTNSNMTVKSYSVRGRTTQAQLAIAHVTDNTELELRGGQKIRRTHSEDLNATLSGINFKYAASSDDFAHGSYFGLYARYGIGESVSLTADGEVTNLSGGEEQVFAKAGIQLKF